ncbi:putative Uncharacterized 50.6 kDa protein in the 5'region of gyrA and gyrB [Streptomyces misionensis JCM 4497]
MHLSGGRRAPFESGHTHVPCPCPPPLPPRPARRGRRRRTRRRARGLRGRQGHRQRRSGGHREVRPLVLQGRPRYDREAGPDPGEHRRLHRRRRRAPRLRRPGQGRLRPHDDQGRQAGRAGRRHGRQQGDRPRQRLGAVQHREVRRPRPGRADQHHVRRRRHPLVRPGGVREEDRRARPERRRLRLRPPAHRAPPADVGPRGVARRRHEGAEGHRREEAVRGGRGPAARRGQGPARDQGDGGQRERPALLRLRHQPLRRPGVLQGARGELRGAAGECEEAGRRLVRVAELGERRQVPGRHHHDGRPDLGHPARGHHQADLEEAARGEGGPGDLPLPRADPVVRQVRTAADEPGRGAGEGEEGPLNRRAEHTQP